MIIIIIIIKQYNKKYDYVGCLEWLRLLNWHDVCTPVTVKTVVDPSYN